MRLRRSPQEIRDRSLQELRNLLLWRFPPRLPQLTIATPLAGLKTPGVPEGSDEVARQIRAHRFPLLGLTIDTGPDIHWRCDYLSGIETDVRYFRLIPYLDANRAGDHKIIWELNRHQHLVLLAQVGAEHLYEIVSELESWMNANPFQCGINWASALEVALRSLSWIWIYHLVGGLFPAPFRQRFLQELYRHGRHLETNLSFYFSPNTHLLGEAVALHAMGVLFPQFPGSGRWRALGKRVVCDEMRKQVRGDGGYFEQSTYYHVYALDMFAFHASLEEAPDDYRASLDRMAFFLYAVMGPARRLPFFGDDDGGRFFQPYGPRDEFGRATLAPWCFDEHVSRLFPDTGLAVMTGGPAHIVADVGPFGPWGSGHSHSDTLSFTLRIGDDDVLIDPGTFTYVGQEAERNWFRGSAAHNTIRIDERDQAVAAGPFRWTDQPSVKILEWRTGPEEDFLDAECSYAGLQHRRTFRFTKSGSLAIEDRIAGPAGDHEIEQWWHLGNAGHKSRFEFDSAGVVRDEPSWASSVFGEKHPAPAVCVHYRGPLPLCLRTQIRCRP